MKDLFNRLLGRAEPSVSRLAGSLPVPNSNLQPIRPDQLLPVVRDYDPADAVAQTTVHRELGAGIAVHLGHVYRTPANRIGLDYVMTHHTDWSAMTAQAAFARAWQNLERGLRVGGIEEPGEPKFFALEHPSGLAASALSLPGFHSQASKWLGADTVFVAIPEPACLFLLRPDTPASARMQDAALRSEYWGAVAFTPSCFLLDTSGLRRVASRPSPSSDNRNGDARDST